MNAGGQVGGERRAGRLAAVAAVAAAVAAVRARVGARGILQLNERAGVDPALRFPGGSRRVVAWLRQKGNTW